jgi:hypothetical protein
MAGRIARVLVAVGNEFGEQESSVVGNRRRQVAR